MTDYTEQEVQKERDHLLLDCGFVHSSPVIKMLTQLADMLAERETASALVTENPAPHAAAPSVPSKTVRVAHPAAQESGR